MCVMEFKDHFNRIDPSFLVFAAPQGNVRDYYYSIDESLVILDKLLKFQLGTDDRVKEFVLVLYNLVDKITPKKNALFVLSAPNAGKNYFFDAVIHLFINFGQVGNFNRYQQFPLMDCVDRRIILWNEPIMEPCAEETLKLLLGGDMCPAKIKYQPDATIFRTPVIILSNNDIFPNNEAFRSRMTQYNWNPCPWLRDLKKKPHPLCILNLFNKYLSI